jgi:hypothetical protein
MGSTYIQARPRCSFGDQNFIQASTLEHLDRTYLKLITNTETQVGQLEQLFVFPTKTTCTAAKLDTSENEMEEAALGPNLRGSRSENIHPTRLRDDS